MAKPSSTNYPYTFFDIVGAGMGLCSVPVARTTKDLSFTALNIFLILLLSQHVFIIFRVFNITGYWLAGYMKKSGSAIPTQRNKDLMVTLPSLKLRQAGMAHKGYQKTNGSLIH